ncbi:uncharacterized protein [Oscarella lobularis]|uniref:uncharacterized protein n=1 Tax=Oscarella lobularis TaxID=121494 RepID=UPI003313BB2C
MDYSRLELLQLSAMNCDPPPHIWLRSDKIVSVDDLALLDDLLLVADIRSQCIWQIDVDTSFDTADFSDDDDQCVYVNAHFFAGVANKEGYKDGPSTEALFHNPSRLAVDQYSRTVYVSDVENGRIRKIHDGVVTTLAGGVDNALKPLSILVREDRSVVFLDMREDNGMFRIYRVAPDGNVTVIAQVALEDVSLWWFVLNLYNGPKGCLILCEGITVNEIRDGAGSCIKTIEEAPNEFIAGYSSKLNSVYVFGYTYLRRLSLSGNEKDENFWSFTDMYFEHYTRLLNDDDYTVYLFQDPSTIIVTALRPDARKAFRRCPTAKFASSYAELLDNEDLVSPDDIVFEVDAKTIRVPLVVLCLRSEFFRRMLLSGFFAESSQCSEGVKRIPVSQYSYDAFRLVLLYLFTGTVDVLMCAPIVTEVCLAADYYLVTDLRDQCLKYMIRDVSTQSVSEYAQIADLMKSGALQKACRRVLRGELD